MSVQAIVPFEINGEKFYTHTSWFSERQFNGWTSIPQQNKNLALYYSLSTVALVGIFFRKSPIVKTFFTSYGKLLIGVGGSIVGGYIGFLGLLKSQEASEFNRLVSRNECGTTPLWTKEEAVVNLRQKDYKTFMARREGRYKFLYSANTMSKMSHHTNQTVSQFKATNSKNLYDHLTENEHSLILNLSIQYYLNQFLKWQTKEFMDSFNGSLYLSFITQMSYNPKQTYLILHKHVQYALQASQQENDFERSAELAPVIQNKKRQLWLLEGSIEDTFNIVNAFTDYLLSEEEEKLVLKSKSGNQQQTWTLQFVSENQFLIRLPKQKQKYLCLRYGNLTFCQCKNPLDPDVWLLKTIVDYPILNKSCFISSTDTLKQMDVTQGSRDQGSIISLRQTNFHYTQRWNIYRAGQIYVIKSLFTQMNLDIFQERFSTQNDVVIWPSNGRISQFWYLQKLYGQTYRIATFFNPQLQLGHRYEKLIIHKGRTYTWIIEGYLPQ